MKKHVLFLLAIIFVSQAFANSVIISNSGNTFSPNDITISFGDTVNFQLGPTHRVKEVSQSSYNANDTTLISGGFVLGFGGGMVTGLTVGIHYYICPPHSNFGMKGKITVTGPASVSPMNSIVFSFYPNPVTEELNISVSNPQSQLLSYKIYNFGGQLIRDAKAQLSNPQNSVKIPVADLPRGIYMITVMSGDNQFTRRIVLF